MKHFFLLSFTVMVLFGCNEKHNQTETITPKDGVQSTNFQMYEMSEMASLMEQMYAYNTQLKERILTGAPLGEYPQAFDKLHIAVLTDASDRDAFFNEQAFKFIEAQKAVYNQTENAKENFNKMVNQCLECHAKKCGGPVPRIKKLLIPEL